MWWLIMFNILSQLTTAFRFKKNNLKILKLISEGLDELEVTFELINSWKDVDKAKGTTLDMMGKEIGQPRGQATDEIYRLLIKGKMLSVSSKGDINTIINIISTIFNVEPSEFDIQELYTEGRPAMLKINKIPLDVVVNAGMTGDELVFLIKQSVAGGVGLDSIELDGTFEFVETLEQGSDIGFADMEMTTGGTLGAIFGKER